MILSKFQSFIIIVRHFVQMLKCLFKFRRVLISVNFKFFNRSEYDTNLANKKDEMKTKKELLEKTMNEIDALEREVEQQFYPKTDKIASISITFSKFDQ